MSQVQQQQFTVDESGKLVTISNALQNSTSIEFDYVIKGAPATVNLVVQGVKNNGDVAILDTYAGLTNAKRVIALSDTYDNFILVATWTGGAGVSVGVTVSSSGPGASFQGGTILPMSGIGSPAGVVAAPVGSIYLNLSGGAGTTLYVKESGGSTSSGWVGK
jgi:hypothetical protein